jgi:hypothetical protein
MSKISLKPNASGTGVFSLEAPNSNVDRTLNLPDEAGTVLTNVSDIESQVKTATNATGSAPVYACRAWVNFDGTGTVSIRDSGNVSSVTDNGTGEYTLNFTTAMPDTNYVITGTAGDVTRLFGRFLTGPHEFHTTRTTSAVAIGSFRPDTSSYEDQSSIEVAIFR